MPSSEKNTVALTNAQREQIATILERRANEIAGYSGDHKEDPIRPERKGMPASVEYALELEIKRLRKLAALVKPPPPPESSEDEE